MGLYEHLDVIRDRPEMYIGESKLKTLRSYISGYLMCADMNNIDASEILPFRLFHDYIALRYGYKESTAGRTNILCDTYGNTKESLSVFFDHVDDFKNEFGSMEQDSIIEYFKENGFDVVDRF